MREYLRHLYRPKIDGRHTFGPAQWWRSAEAIAPAGGVAAGPGALTTRPLHRAERVVRDHPDPHMRVLMGDAGPFSKDINPRADLTDPLPNQAPPEGLFPDVRPAGITGSEPSPVVELNPVKRKRSVYGLKP